MPDNLSEVKGWKERDARGCDRPCCLAGGGKQRVGCVKLDDVVVVIVRAWRPAW